MFDVDARLDPTGESPVDGTAFDLRGGRRVGELRLDTAFRIHASTTGSGGLMESARLAGPDADTVLLQDADWAFVQVFTTDTYRSDTGQGDTGPIGAIAVEPMSAPPDALNSGIGLAWIEPGASWTGSWALRRDTR